MASGNYNKNSSPHGGTVVILNPQYSCLFLDQRTAFQDENAVTFLTADFYADVDIAAFVKDLYYRALFDLSERDAANSSAYLHCAASSKSASQSITERLNRGERTKSPGSPAGFPKLDETFGHSR
jgi:hypothetical protein